MVDQAFPLIALCMVSAAKSTSPQMTLCGSDANPMAAFSVSLRVRLVSSGGKKTRQDGLS
jgi:hypothetical protein